MERKIELLNRIPIYCTFQTLLNSNMATVNYTEINFDALVTVEPLDLGPGSGWVRCTDANGDFWYEQEDEPIEAAAAGSPIKN